MKVLIPLFLVVVSLSGHESHAADTYQVTVTRVESNLYKDLDSGNYIKTRYCLEMATGERSILIYSKSSYRNKLIFDNGAECEVESVFKIGE